MSVLLLFITHFRNKDLRRLYATASKAAGLAICLLLAGCQSMAPPAGENPSWVRQRAQLLNLQEWQLRGRVNVRYYDESHTPRIQWQQNQEQYHIRLWGTFNAGNTEIEGRPGRVTLEQDGEVLSAESPEDLILDQLGYELPVSHLEYWIKGVPAPAGEAQLAFNELNQLTSLQQDGWSVSYSDMRQYQQLSLPRRVDVSREAGDVRLRFVGLDWTVAPPSGLNANN